MKIIGTILGIILLAVFDVIAEITDEQIKSNIVMSSTVFDNPRFADGIVRRTLYACDYDTNRLVRVLHELSNERIDLRDYIFSQLRTYGNNTALPLLYQCVTNSTDLKAGFQASWAILEIEGVTSNSIAQIDRFLKLPQNNTTAGSSACRRLLSYAKKTGVPLCLKDRALSCAVEYAARNNLFPDIVDKSVISIDPTYRMSRRRLVTLRAVTTLGVSPRCTNYVATAINELVAYPEANLPE